MAREARVRRGRRRTGKRMRIKDVGRKVDFPKQLFSRLLVLSSILAFLAFSNMSNHFNRTQRQNAASTNYESVIQRGIGMGRPHADYYRYHSPRVQETISRGIVARMPFARGSSSRPYPSIQDIANRARSNQMQHDTFSDLYLGDLIFASAITVEELLAPQRELRAAQVPALCALLGRGYFDRSGSEPRNDQEERAIRYAASVGGYLLDFAAGTAAQV